jgi:hypothetical protein
MSGRVGARSVPRADASVDQKQSAIGAGQHYWHNSERPTGN